MSFVKSIVEEQTKKKLAEKCVCLKMGILTDCCLSASRGVGNKTSTVKLLMFEFILFMNQIIINGDGNEGNIEEEHDPDQS